MTKGRLYGEKLRMEIMIEGLPGWAIFVKRAGRMVVPEFMFKRWAREFLERQYEKLVMKNAGQLPAELQNYFVVLQHHRQQSGHVRSLFCREGIWYSFWKSTEKSVIVGEYVLITPRFPWQ